MSDIEGLLHHSAWLRRLAGRLVAEGAGADDLVQDVWVAALERAPDPWRPAQPWLAGVARRIESLRSRTRARRRARELDAARDEARPDASAAVERIELERRLAAAVLALPEPARSTILLRYYDELSIAEVARKLGIPQATVRTRTKRGLDVLRERLDREWGERGAWCACFAALAEGGQASGAIPGAGTASSAAGAAIMASSKSIVAAIVLLGIGAAVWKATDGARGARDEPAVASAIEPRARAAELESGSSGATDASEAGERASAPGSEVASDATTESEPLARFTLVESDARPAAERRVALVTAEAPLESTTSDSEGRVSFAARAAAGWLVIERARSLPHVEQVALAAGEARIVLPQGSALAGTIVYADGSPADGVALELESDHAPFAALARARFDELEIPESSPIATANDGGFAWLDLPRDWSGSLRLPAGFYFEGEVGNPRERAELRIAAPATGLTLVVARYPRIHGRVVDASTGARAANARVGLNVGLSAGGFSANLHADRDGRFEHFLSRTGRGRIYTTLLAADGSRPRTIDHGELEIGADGLDLGTLELSSGAGLRFHVVDSDGRAVARASSYPAPLRESDASGLLVIPGLACGERVAVTLFADGYLPAQRIAAFARSDEPIRVVLERAATLALVVREATGSALTAGTVQLAAPHELFSGSPVAHPHGSARSAFQRGTNDNGGACEYDFRIDASGRLQVAELLPSRSFEVRVLDDLREVCATRVVDGIEAAAVREIEIDLSADVRPFEGTVRDASERPLSGVSIVLGSSAAGRETDAGGRFAFALVSAQAIDLVASKRGYVRRAVSQLPLPPRGEFVELRLERGRDVELELVHDDGAAVSSASARILSDDGGPERSFETRADGRLVLEDLPLAEFEIEVSVGDARSRFTVPGAVERARFVLPPD